VSLALALGYYEVSLKSIHKFFLLYMSTGYDFFWLLADLWKYANVQSGSLNLGFSCIQLCVHPPLHAYSSTHRMRHLAQQEPLPYYR